MFKRDGKGFIFTGKVDGRDFPMMVMVPEDDPEAARFLFPKEGEEFGPSLNVDEAFACLGDDVLPGVKQVVETAIKLIAELCDEEGWQDAAIFYARKLLKYTEDPEEKARTWLWLGCRMEGLENFAEAATCYQKAVDLEPTDQYVRYFAHNNLGYSLNQISRHQPAEAHCREAIRIIPDRHNAHKNLGIALQEQDKGSAAAECFVRAAEIEPGDMRAMTHLRVLLSKHPAIAVERPDFCERMEAIYGIMWTQMSSN